MQLRLSQNNIVITLPHLQFFSKVEEWWHDGPTTRTGKIVIEEKDMSLGCRKALSASWGRRINFKVNQQGRGQRIIKGAIILGMETQWTPKGIVYEYTYKW